MEEDEKEDPSYTSDDDTSRNDSLDEDVWLNSRTYSRLGLSNYIKRLQSRQDSACSCGVVRLRRLNCHTEERTEKLQRVAESSSGTVLLHRSLVVPGEEVSLTAQQYIASPHCANPAVEVDRPEVPLKMVRVTFETHRAAPASRQPLPVDSWWLTCWQRRRSARRAASAFPLDSIQALVRPPQPVRSPPRGPSPSTHPLFPRPAASTPAITPSKLLLKTTSTQPAVAAPLL